MYFGKLTRLMAVAMIGGGALVMGGCSELLGDDDDDNRSSRRDSDTLSRTRTSDTRTGRDTSDSRNRVPSGATILEQGRGNLTATAREAGTIYLYDADDQRVVWSGRIGRGQQFAVDPDADRAVIESEPVYRQNLEREHTHRIYFSPSR